MSEIKPGARIGFIGLGKMGDIAGNAAIAAFAGAGLSLVFSILGFHHASKVIPD